MVALVETTTRNVPASWREDNASWRNGACKGIGGTLLTGDGGRHNILTRRRNALWGPGDFDQRATAFGPFLHTTPRHPTATEKEYCFSFVEGGTVHERGC